MRITWYNGGLWFEPRTKDEIGMLKALYDVIQAGGHDVGDDGDVEMISIRDFLKNRPDIQHTGGAATALADRSGNPV